MFGVNVSTGAVGASELHIGGHSMADDRTTLQRGGTRRPQGMRPYFAAAWGEVEGACVLPLPINPV